MRLYNRSAEVDCEPVGAEVELVDGHQPTRFTAWGCDYLVVEVQSCWSRDREWWVADDPGEVRPLWFWRVKARGTRDAVVVLREDCGVWHVVGVED
jgi:hypothetical protein